MDIVLILATVLGLTWLGIFICLAYMYGRARALTRRRPPVRW